MVRTDKRYVLKRIAAVRKRVSEEISAHARDGGKFGRGTASEGFSGGYLMALNDVEAALQHGYPSDHRGYWTEET